MSGMQPKLGAGAAIGTCLMPSFVADFASSLKAVLTSAREELVIGDGINICLLRGSGAVVVTALTGGST